MGLFAPGPGKPDIYKPHLFPRGPGIAGGGKGVVRMEFFPGAPGHFPGAGGAYGGKFLQRIVGNRKDVPFYFILVGAYAPQETSAGPGYTADFCGYDRLAGRRN